jgi:hypothetical protein
MVRALLQRWTLTLAVVFCSRLAGIKISHSYTPVPTTNSVVPRQNANRPKNQSLRSPGFANSLIQLHVMFQLILPCFGSLFRLFRKRASLLIENLVLRQQLAVLKRRHPRPSLPVVDKFFWVVTHRF